MNGDALEEDGLQIGRERDRPSELSDVNDCYETAWVKHNRIHYQPAAVVVLKVEDDMPVFGRIERIFIVNSNDVFLLCENIIDDSNSNYHHVYLLNAASDNYSCIKINRLYNVPSLFKKN